MKRDYTLVVVDKALDVLEFLSRQREPAGLQELSQALDIPKATLFRYLFTLEQRGYVRKDAKDGAYTLGLRVLELADEALGRLTVHEAALPGMRELLYRFRETVNLGVHEGKEVVYVEILESPQSFKMSAHVGGRDYLHTTSIGKAILAFLPQKQVHRLLEETGLPARTQNSITSLPELEQELALTRERGYAIDNEENENGARCVGAPIFDRSGRVIAALSITGLAMRSSMAEIEEQGRALLEVTSEISSKMGYLG